MAPRSQARSVGAWPTWGGGGTTEPDQISRGLADMGGVAPRSQARSVGAWPTWGGDGTTEPGQISRGLADMGGGWHHGARPDQ